MKRRPLNVFSLSFIDCITCGLGAIILLFVIVNAKNAIHRNEVITDLRAEVSRLEQTVHDGKKRLVEVRNALTATQKEWVITRGLSRQVIKTIETHREERAHYRADTLASKTHVNKLKADLKSLDEALKRLEAGRKARDEAGSRQRTFPGQGDRHYLTDLKMGGKRILILVDASASMLDDTIVGIIRRRHLSEAEKTRSVKWQQAVNTVDWLTTQLPTTSQFQIYTFNETVTPLLADTRGKWLEAGEVATLDKAVHQLRRVVPGKGTSLLNALIALKGMRPRPDNVFLLTDSLPTMGATKPRSKTVSGKKRLRLFEAAVRQLPPGIPVNIILYPMEGDPLAAAAFWRLAAVTDGAFFSPARDWP